MESQSGVLAKHVLIVFIHPAIFTVIGHRCFLGKPTKKEKLWSLENIFKFIFISYNMLS